MELIFNKEIGDPRGKFLQYLYGNKRINIVETKKGHYRGGHYRPYESSYVFITGKIEYREENVQTKHEQVRIISSPAIVPVPPNVANLLIALEDTIFVDLFDSQYIGHVYPKYREIVEDKMKSVK